MTDTTTDTSDASSTDDLPGVSEEAVRGYLLKGALVALALVAVGATVGFYLSAVAAIDEWVAREYRPLFRAAFNLVIVLAAGVGISMVLRELAG